MGNLQANPLPETSGVAFYSLDMLAKRWNTSYRNVHRQVKQGKVKALRLGGILRVSAETVRKIERHGF